MGNYLNFFYLFFFTHKKLQSAQPQKGVSFINFDHFFGLKIFFVKILQVLEYYEILKFFFSPIL